MGKVRRQLAAIGVCFACIAAPAWVVGADAGDAGAPDGTTTGDASGTFEATLSQEFVAPATPRVGDPLRLKLTVGHPPDADVRTGLSLDASSRWTLADSNTRTEGREADRRTHVEYVLQVARPGDTTLESFPVVVERDGERATLRTDPVDIDIASVVDNPGEASFTGPLPPAVVQVPDYTLVWLAGVGGGFGLALVALFFWRRGRGEEAELERPPEEVALERLRALRESDRLARGDYQYVYVRMSLHVRRYLGRRFGFPGAEMTTAEVLDELQDKSLPDELPFDDIVDWFHHVDRVKFSGLVPPDERARDALRTAIDLVERTRPEAYQTQGDGGDEEDDGGDEGDDGGDKGDDVDESKDPSRADEEPS